MKCSKSSSENFWQDFGEVYKAKYWFAKKIFGKSQTVRLVGVGTCCHYTICEIAGFSHGFCLFSIVLPYEYFSHRFEWKRTSVRSFCDMIWNCTLRSISLFSSRKYRNGLKLQNLRLYDLRSLLSAQWALSLSARVVYKVRTPYIYSTQINFFHCVVPSSIENSLLETFIPDVSLRAWFTKDALHVPKTQNTPRLLHPKAWWVSEAVGRRHPLPRSTSPPWVRSVGRTEAQGRIPLPETTDG